jgi:SAM-dependent MidA family methyltransferase
MTGWAAAWQRAVYGPGGWAHRPEGPAGHFRTSAHVPLFATAIAELLRRVDLALGSPDEVAIVDIGAGRGELLSGVVAAIDGELSARVRAVAVERAARPDRLAPQIEWVAEPPRSVVGLVIANEWLDDVPLDVALRHGGALRQVAVDGDGHEEPGDRCAEAEIAWAERWWPAGDRVELGVSRDEAWAVAVARLERGLAVAVDYGHLREARPPAGTLTGFRDGREVTAVPDGQRNLTAHVAIDAVAAAGEAAGAQASLLLSQREALDRLGLTAERPDRALASRDPAGYLGALQRRGSLAELRDPLGLGRFFWLAQGIGVDPVDILG